MNNEEKIIQIQKWQNCKYVHPLTCGKEGCHESLYPEIIKEKVAPNVEMTKETIILKCPKCNYRQNVIPECVFLLNLDEITKKMG